MSGAAAADMCASSAASLSSAPVVFDGVGAVLTDIEGTIAPIAFVHEVLFPHARAGLAELLAGADARPEVAAAVARVRALAPGRDPLAALLDWMDADLKCEPLKTLQGMVWARGYADGSLVGALYEDVAPRLRGWRRDGVRLAVYSSGSEAAQRLLLGFSTAGDLVPLFDAFFDTRVGAKREPGSYLAIASALGLAPAAVLFLSDVAAELDAARAAGMRCCQIVRAADGTRADGGHPRADGLDRIVVRAPPAEARAR